MKRNAKILMYEDNKECDMCDSIGNCVTISSLSNDCVIICIDCINKINKEMDK